MNLHALFICLALVNYVVAVTFVSPTKDTIWTSTGPNFIEWTFSNGTTAFANIQLLHNNNSIFQPIPLLLTPDGLLATGIDVAAGVFDVVPYCIPGNPSLPIGTGYSLRMFSEIPDGTTTTLAVTNGTFNIVAGQPTTCPSFSTSTTSGASSSGQSTSTATTSVSPSSSSSKSRAGAIAGGVVGGLVACLLVVVMVIYNKHRRMARLMTTQQFMKRKGLAIGKLVDHKDPEMH